MKTMTDVRSALADFEREMRRPGLPAWRLSGLYAVTRGQPVPPGEATAGAWPEDWPGAASRGVYFLLASDGELLYVGKASMHSTIGRRLGTYFQWDDARTSCRVVGHWSKPPAYIATLAVPDSLSFEAATLEEYLIGRLNPPDNTLGRRDTI